MMTIQVQLDPETESELASVSKAHGLAPEAYAERILHRALVSLRREQQLSLNDFHAMLDQLSADSECLPDLPTSSFTRESFYEDHG